MVSSHSLATRKIDNEIGENGFLHYSKGDLILQFIFPNLRCTKFLQLELLR